MSAIETWGEMVRVEHEQSDRMRGVRPTDTWTQFASQFKADPHRTDDAVVEELRSRMMHGETLLDVGAGGGRLALPLALTCGTVTAVEPSPSMCAVLRETAQEYGIANVSIVEAGWLEASVEPADVVLCSHVVYVIEDIGAFVRKMDRHARRMVLAIVFRSSPLSYVYGLWEQVHGETRHALPALPQFLPVLEELGISAEVTELAEQPRREFDSFEQARETIARQLYVSPGTEAMGRLERVLERALQDEGGVWSVEGAQRPRPCIVAWETGGR
ncbi:MAG: class I SAM-dependent methyltransferase [Dehalococcoidia bacterium]|nr:class I SAM-dependent methyltransferase [Dehalococcoidia bacterium]